MNTIEQVKTAFETEFPSVPFTFNEFVTEMGGPAIQVCGTHSSGKLLTVYALAEKPIQISLDTWKYCFDAGPAA